MAKDGDSSRATSGAMYRVEALSKGLKVLGLFNENRLNLRLKDIAELTSIPLPTAFRIVATLQQDGYIERRHDGSYQPGLAVLTLGSAATRSSGLVQLSETPLRELASKTGETVNLGVLLGDRVLYLVRLRNADLVTANIQVGSTLPAVLTSMGKLLLSALDDAELEHIYTGIRFGQDSGPNAISDLPRLREQIAAIRAQGYAIQDEELAQGLRSIAAPILGEDGKTVAAVNIAVSSSRHEVSELRGSFLPLLLATTSVISRSLQRA